ncbi:hypothetical protein C1J03_06905 [Sulfitobacter sp. SK012]|uniref:DUF3124 domain-containing protein n=1 Tax=Sulfitobacter sp. SK012 TaxID=1389005 RepID=UPI000E0C05EF|nr:DUF3124 domain-containing protein [Sulfitobacter sp. SK012]AXI45783.1 hypothetical protein C1J03_06905 [Sulfitobacter sp. SK012]
MKIWMNLIPLAFTAMTSWAHADGIVLKALSETIYVPAYSEVPIGPGSSHQMAVTIVIHNVDPEQPVNLQTVTYHDHQGKQVQSLLQEAITIPPFGSWKHLIDIRDKTGGVGANFLINWTSEAPANSPIAEALMIGGTGTQGISFTSRGQAISRDVVGVSSN